MGPPRLANCLIVITGHMDALPLGASFEVGDVLLTPEGAQRLAAQIQADLLRLCAARGTCPVCGAAWPGKLTRAPAPEKPRFVPPQPDEYYPY